MRAHKLGKKSSKRKRHFGLDREATAADTNALKKMLGMR
jgi:ribosomal protein L35